jgi:hypothetical protein
MRQFVRYKSRAHWGCHTLHFDIFSRLDASTVRPHAVSVTPSSVVANKEGAASAVLLGSRGFDLVNVSHVY